MRAAAASDSLELLTWGCRACKKKLQFLYVLEEPCLVLGAISNTLSSFIPPIFDLHYVSNVLNVSNLWGCQAISSYSAFSGNAVHLNVSFLSCLWSMPHLHLSDAQSGFQILCRSHPNTASQIFEPNSLNP